MKQTKVFEAYDGEQFDTAEKCKAHEHKMFVGRLVGLSEAQVTEALERRPSCLSLADDFERAGAVIAAKRRENGELRRAKKATHKADTAMQMSAIKENVKAIS